MLKLHYYIKLQIIVDFSIIAFNAISPHPTKYREKKILFPDHTNHMAKNPNG